MKKIFIIIAAYNEARSISSVIKGLRKAKYTNIVVVDDCSQDTTYNVAERAGAVVLRHMVNRGQGAALRTGIEYALEHGAGICVTFDADGQHRIEDLPAMLKPVLSGKFDVALGSRFMKKRGNIPLRRKLTLRIAVLVQNIFYGIHLTDAHNGFRVFSRKAAQAINITCDRMAHASEIAEQIHTHNLRYKEVPIIIKYSKETLEKGHGSFGQGIRVFFDMLMKKLSR